MESISFFWACLSDLQHGCNVGLEKPLSILKNMVHEFRVSVKEGGEMPQQTSLDGTFFQFPMGVQSAEPCQNGSQSIFYPESDYIAGDPVDFGAESVSPDFLGSMNELERDLTHDTLYGLFAPNMLQ